jgi:RNA 2',3'-cyclic 3'-phosphodiesterase
MAEIRTFICFELPENIKAALAQVQDRLRPLGHGVSWSRIDGIHLTLKFLGDVDESHIDAVAAAVKRVCAGQAPLEMALAGAGAFPNLKRPRVYWAGIGESSGRLLILQKKIDEALAELGFPKETRPFSPHLTLGRVKFLDQPEKIAQTIEAYHPEVLPFTVDEIVVMKSDLKPSGAIYTPLRRISFDSR